VRIIILTAALAGCAEETCPTGSALDTESGLCTLIAQDTGGQFVYSECPADTGMFEDPVAVDASLTWAGWGDGFFRTYCRSCHSRQASTRRGAPDDVQFDTEADVIAWGARVRDRVIQDGTMPLGGGVMEDDLVLLDRYLCRLGATP
jgi:hypothetical protein